VVSRSYDVGDYLVGVRTNSEAVGAWLDRYLGDLRTSEDAEPYYSILVADESDRRPGRRFNILYRESIAVARTFEVAGVVRTLLSELEGLLARGRNDAVYTDLAPVTSNGTVALIPASTVAFLDTLGGRVRRAGLVLPIATRTAIDPVSGELIPIQPLLRVPPEAPDELRGVGSGVDDSRLLLDCPARVDVVCAVGGSATETLLPLTPGGAVHRLATHVLNLEQLGVGALEGLSRLTSGARCYELRSAKSREMLESLSAAMRPG
jgi:hypothetical protein